MARKTRSEVSTRVPVAQHKHVQEGKIYDIWNAIIVITLVSLNLYGGRACSERVGNCHMLAVSSYLETALVAEG